MSDRRCKHKTYEEGFTLPELIVVIGVFSVLLSVIVINLLTAHSNVSLASTIEVLIADIKDQQNKSMAGDTMGTSSNQNFGIYLESNQYTLFHGPSYTPGDSSNFVVELDNTVSFDSISFPSSQIVFSSGSGEINGFVSGSDSLVVKGSTTSQQKTIKLNRYGVVTQAN